MQLQQTLKPRGSFGEIARYQRFVAASSVILPVRAVSKLLICGVKRTHKAAPPHHAVAADIAHCRSRLNRVVRTCEVTIDRAFEAFLITRT